MADAADRPENPDRPDEPDRPEQPGGDEPQGTGPDHPGHGSDDGAGSRRVPGFGGASPFSLFGEEADKFFEQRRARGGGGPRRPGGGGPRRPGGGGAGGADGSQRGTSRPVVPPRIGPLGWTMLVLPLLVVLGMLAAHLWTEVLWYRSVGASRVFWTEWLTRGGLFLAGGLVTAALVLSSLLIAHRNRPVLVPDTPQAVAVDRYREAIEPFRRIVFVGVPILFGFFSAMSLQRQWKALLLWWHSQAFGVQDPQFHRDIGFYVFDLPWLGFLSSFAQTVLITTLLVALLTHYVYGGLMIGKGGRTTRTALIHLSLLAAGIVLVLAARYWLHRYELLSQRNGIVTGATYTDAHAVIPTQAILAAASLLCAAMFVATIWSRSWRLPVIGVVGLLAIAVVVGSAYPGAIKAFKVRPSEQSLEAEYISRNIDATRRAYGLSDVEVTPYDAKTTASSGQLRGDADTVPGIRLVDPSLVSPTFAQLQGVKSFYRFPETLDVDRYPIGGKQQDVVVAVRELDLAGLQPGQRNWLNDHTVYTHGFGVVAAHGNQRTSEGNPVFAASEIPPRGELPPFEPRVYFGENSPEYSLVGAPEGAEPRELDYPDSGATGQKNTTYRGSGGVPIGNWLTRAAYATRYAELKFLLSDAVNPETKILDHRHPKDRVQRVAPWLTLDENIYPAVVNKRLVWIVDGYTTTDKFPYSELQSFGDATRDSRSGGQTAVQAPGAGEKVNYIRNAVKAVVDAYDGTVTLYQWDQDDPVLKTWMGIFPDLVRPTSEISADLMSHLRYPEDLFKVQRELMSHYHVTEPHAYYSGQDFWRVPTDPTLNRDQDRRAQPPYYLSIAMPGQETPAFSLTSAFIPMGNSGEGNNREVLSAFMAVDADAGREAGKVRKGYGKLRLLELPKNTTVKGPGQLQNAIESSNVGSKDFAQTLSQYLSLNRQQESQVQLGNMLTLPVGGGLLYVEPIYVSKKGSSSFPLQRLVVVAFGDRLAWASTLDGALDELFGGNSGANAGDAGQGSKDTSHPGTGGATPSPSPGDGGSSGTSSPTTTPSGSPDPAKLKQALADAEKAYQDGEAAMKKGDWTEYGKAQGRLKDALARAMAAQPEGGSTPSLGSTSTPPPSTSAPAPTSTPATEGSPTPTA